jgi:hypothetical protein
MIGCQGRWGRRQRQDVTDGLWKWYDPLLPRLVASAAAAAAAATAGAGLQRPQFLCHGQEPPNWHWAWFLLSFRSLQELVKVPTFNTNT